MRAERDPRRGFRDDNMLGLYDEREPVLDTGELMEEDEFLEALRRRPEWMKK